MNDFRLRAQHTRAPPSGSKQHRRLLKIDIGKNPHIGDVAFNVILISILISNYNFNFKFNENPGEKPTYR